MGSYQLVIQFSMFIGVIAFIATLGAGDLIDVGGINKIQDFNAQPRDIDIDTFQNSSKIEQVKFTKPSGEQVDAIKGSENISNSLNDFGFVEYNVAGTNNLDVEVYGSLLYNDLIRLYKVDTNDSVQLAPFSSDEVVTTNVDVSDTDTIQIRFYSRENFLLGLTATENNRGFLSRLSAFADIFILNTNSNWFYFLVVLPLIMFSTYVLLRTAGDYIPTT